MSAQCIGANSVYKHTHTHSRKLVHSTEGRNVSMALISDKQSGRQVRHFCMISTFLLSKSLILCISCSNHWELCLMSIAVSPHITNRLWFVHPHQSWASLHITGSDVSDVCWLYHQWESITLHVACSEQIRRKFTVRSPLSFILKISASNLK